MFSGLLWWKDNLIISDRAHLVFNFHQKIDAALETMKGGSKLDFLFNFIEIVIKSDFQAWYDQERNWTNIFKQSWKSQSKNL